MPEAKSDKKLTFLAKLPSFNRKICQKFQPNQVLYQSGVKLGFSTRKRLILGPSYRLSDEASERENSEKEEKSREH